MPARLLVEFVYIKSFILWKWYIFSTGIFSTSSKNTYTGVEISCWRQGEEQLLSFAKYQVQPLLWLAVGKHNADSSWTKTLILTLGWCMSDHFQPLDQ